MAFQEALAIYKLKANYAAQASAAKVFTYEDYYTPPIVMPEPKPKDKPLKDKQGRKFR